MEKLKPEDKKSLRYLISKEIYSDNTIHYETYDGKIIELIKVTELNTTQTLCYNLVKCEFGIVPTSRIMSKEEYEKVKIERINSANSEIEHVLQQHGLTKEDYFKYRKEQNEM